MYKPLAALLVAVLLTLACEAGPPPDVSRCYQAPEWLSRQIENGITAEGLFMERDLKRVHVVDNNDGRSWHFIGAAIYAPGMDGIVGVWATAYLAEPALLVAANTMADEFSQWGRPGPGRFADKFDDEIAAAAQCAKEASGL